MRGLRPRISLWRITCAWKTDVGSFFPAVAGGIPPAAPFRCPIRQDSGGALPLGLALRRLDEIPDQPKGTDGRVHLRTTFRPRLRRPSPRYSAALPNCKGIVPLKSVALVWC